MDNRIKAIMAQKKITGRDLAAKMGLSTVGLCKLLNGQSEISLNRAGQFAEALDVEFWELFYSREELLNSVTNVPAGNYVDCPYCGKHLVLCIR